MQPEVRQSQPADTVIVQPSGNGEQDNTLPSSTGASSSSDSSASTGSSAPSSGRGEGNSSESDGASAGGSGGGGGGGDDDQAASASDPDLTDTRALDVMTIAQNLELAHEVIMDENFRLKKVEAQPGRSVWAPVHTDIYYQMRPMQ